MTLDPGQAARRFAELNHALASKRTISAQFADAVDQALRNLIESDRRLWKTADADLVTPLLLAVYEAQRTVSHRRHVDARDDLRIALASISQSLALIAEEEPVARHRSGRELARWLAEIPQLSQQEIAEVLGVSLSTFRRWISPNETTEPNPKHAYRLLVVAKLMQQLRHVLTPAGILSWYETPLAALDERPPSLLLDEPGAFPRLLRLAQHLRENDGG